MILIRRAAEPFHKNSHYDEYERLRNIAQEIVTLENEIETMRDSVSAAMYTIISGMSERETALQAKEIRRKAYHNYSFVYNISLFEQYSAEKDEHIFVLQCDVYKRKNLAAKLTEIVSMGEIINREVKSELESLCNDAKFMDRVCIANPSLYALVNRVGRPTRRSHFVTLLKYVYKQETCCTPSSLWSGIAIGGKNPQVSTAIFGDYNKTRIKYEVRKRVVEEWERYENNVKVFVNPTLLKDGTYYLMVQFFEDRMNKIRIRSNQYIETLYLYYRKKTFTTYELNVNFPIFKSQVILELIKCDILRIESYFPYGDSGLQKVPIVKESDGFDNHNIRFQNTDITDSIQKNIISDAQSAFSTYRQIYDAFFDNWHFGMDYLRLKDYLRRTGRQSLLTFLYSDFMFVVQEADTGRKTRTWSCPSSNQRLFSLFCNLIKERCRNIDFGEILYMHLDEFGKFFPLNREYKQEWVEAVFQYDEQSSSVIPEMLSLTVGRFFGRYGRLFPEIEADLYKEILDYDSIQINVETNGAKDNISYNNPYCKKRAVLYDLDEKCEKESEELYTLDDIFVEVIDDEIVLSSEKDARIKINCASTLSPSNSKIYQLFSYLTNLDSRNSPLGGTVKTRLELDLDYQPRIVVDKLLISRQRWRFRKEDPILACIVKRDELAVLKWMAENKLPIEFYVYTDAKPKPRYCRLGTALDLTNLSSIVCEADVYFYIEEVYPNYRSNEKVVPYNMEVLCQLCLN